MSFGPKYRSPLALFLLAALLWALPAAAKDKTIRIPLPKRTKSTPVQNLNRDGVKAIEKNDYEKAKALFYKAYLLDPNDPFTLNNLGYIAELEGEVERAQRFYALAAEMPSDAMVDRASSEQVVGKRVADVAGKTDDVGMQVNRMNVEAIGLLLKDRAPEADLLLTKALQLDRKNPFTLNNLGFAKEKEGELEVALSYYSAAAVTGSDEPVVVTVNSDWRGKPISEVAGQNASKVRKTMRRAESSEARVARLNLRGVSALNRNDRGQARKYFEEAFKLAPYDAFTLNNMGFVAELDGDRETANHYYRKSQEAERRDARVYMASRRQAEGRPIGEVARTGDEAVAGRMMAELEAKRRSGVPIMLRRRDNSLVIDPAPQPEATSAPGMASPPSEPGAVATPPATSPVTPENAPPHPEPGWRPAEQGPPPVTEEIPPAQQPSPDLPQGESPEPITPPPSSTDVPPPPDQQPPGDSPTPPPPAEEPR